MLMKNIYKMLYTFDNLSEQEDDFVEIDSLIDEEENQDVKQLFNSIEIVPDQKIVDEILDFAFNM